MEGATIAEKVRFLSDPASHEAGVETVTVRETHMSWIFMAGSKVFKLKKPVRYVNLDFLTMARREAACRAEFRLNRRLAPDVYLGVVPLLADRSGLSIGDERIAEGAAFVDWLVVMRRLDESATLERRLLEGRLESAAPDRIATTLATFYRRARPVPVSPGRNVSQWHRDIADTRDTLLDWRFGLPRACIRRVCSALFAFLEVHRSTLLRRVRENRIIDCHGDLRPEHIWLNDDGTVTIIDCLEFSSRLRALDPLEEVAYLDLESAQIKGSWVGPRIRRRLRSMLGDDRSSGLFRFYRCYRAMLRARLSITHLLDDDPPPADPWQLRSRAYLASADSDAARVMLAVNSRRGQKAAGRNEAGR